jgi:hypothetical protein
MWSRILWTAVVSVLLIGLVQTGAQRWTPAEAAASAGELDPRCLAADRAHVALLVPLLTRGAQKDIAILDRAIHALNVARRHCQYGWVEPAMDNYRWLADWIESHR